MPNVHRIASSVHVPALAILTLAYACTPAPSSVTPSAAPPPIKATGAAGTPAPTIAITAPSIPATTAGRSAATTVAIGGAGTTALIAGSGGMNAAGAGGTKAAPAAIGGSSANSAGHGAAGTAANGGSGGAAGADSGADPADPSARDVNGPCKDLDLFCFDPFDMFIFNPECFTCNNGMGCQSCENFQAI